MPSKSKTSAAKSKQAPVSLTSETIEEQIEAFFQAGGEINHIRTGVSGQKQVSGPKHISLGNKPRK